MNIQVGSRIDIFQVKNNIYGNFWRVNGWYAESVESERYNHPDYKGHAKYGRDMVSDRFAVIYIPHQNIINDTVKKGMVKVGTMIIKSIKP